MDDGRGNARLGLASSSGSRFHMTVSARARLLKSLLVIRHRARRLREARSVGASRSSLGAGRRPEARFSSELGGIYGIPPTSYKNTVLSQADHAIAHSATMEVCLAHNDHHCWNGRSAAIETEWANQWTGIWTNDRCRN